MSIKTADLGVKLADLWDDERCVWRMDFDSGAGATTPWIVILEWTQEYDNPHHADWATYTWQFYGETIEVALYDAVEWLEQLWLLAPCRECDGLGKWNGKRCDDCAGTGLANREAVA